MMGVIADVHGNYPALKAVLDVLDAMDCTEILSMGDLAGYYCMINETLEQCASRNVVNIRGNHDDYLLSDNPCPRSMTANLCIAFQRRVVTAKNMTFLERSIPEYHTRQLWAVHGGWNNALDEYINTFAFDRFRDCPEKLFASAHTHVQRMESMDGVIYFNPGSVGQPRDGDPRAAFAVIDDNLQVALHRVSYDIDFIANEMKRNGFERRYYENLYEGRPIRSFDQASSSK